MPPQPTPRQETTAPKTVTRTTLAERLERLSDLLGTLVPVPPEWLTAAPKSKNQGKGINPTPCNNYSTLLDAWKVAMLWTDGLDHGLTVILASVASTRSVGDQLWIKLIGPASCISGKSQVKFAVRDKASGRRINKKGGSMERLYQRFHGLPQRHAGPRQIAATNLDFFIQSVTDEGYVYLNRIKDVVKNGVKEVYRICTTSGMTVDATPDHEFLTEDGYIQLGSLKPGDCVMVHHGKTQPKGRTPVRYKKEVLVKNHPTATEKVVNGCTYYRLTVYRAVYEAHKNSMDYQTYIKFLNKGGEDLSEIYTVPRGKHIHHVDENPNNNNPENLMVLDNPSHGGEHAKEATKQLLTNVEADEITSITSIGTTEVYDVVCAEPHRNFIAGGIVVHNCGKSTLCEAISTAKKYVLPKSTLRGFHSGYRLDNGKNCSLLTKLNGMSLVTKDGDTLLQSPNCDQILSEARDVYDSVSRSDYRNNMGMDHEGLRMTWILAGTSSLRQIDESELGERFLDCVIMHSIDEEMEDQVLWHVVKRASRNVSLEANGQPEKQYEPELVVAMGLTGGYVEYLRENAHKSLEQIEVSHKSMSYIARLGKFVAYMRARPSLRQEEEAERELASRLVSQHMRLAMCLAYVLNRSSVDDDILKRTKRVALDTARGLGLNITRQLYKNHLGGIQSRTIAIKLGMDQNKCRKLLQFYRRIGATHNFRPKLGNGADGPERWKLSDQLKELCDAIIKPEA